MKRPSNENGTRPSPSRVPSQQRNTEKVLGEHTLYANKRISRPIPSRQRPSFFFKGRPSVPASLYRDAGWDAPVRIRNISLERHLRSPHPTCLEA
jgi:hypothetical protein